LLFWLFQKIALHLHRVYPILMFRYFPTNFVIKHYFAINRLINVPAIFQMCNYCCYTILAKGTDAKYLIDNTPFCEINRFPSLFVIVFYIMIIPQCYYNVNVYLCINLIIRYIVITNPDNIIIRCYN